MRTDKELLIPVGHGIGVDAPGKHLEQLADLGPTLWHSCEVRATVVAEPATRPDPDAALTEILGELRFLLAHGCAYLDVVG